MSYKTLKSFKTNLATVLTKLFKIYVRPQFELSTQSWYPLLKKEIIKIESVERKFTHFIFDHCKIPNTSYNDRLIKLDLKSLKYRK